MKSLLITLAVVAIFFVGKHLYMKPKFMIGVDAPNIVAKLANGDAFELDKLRENNMVLLDFWGSWCGPCRAENPSLVKLFAEFHGKDFTDFDGFEIVSVAIETNEESWKKAVEKDKLSWPFHILQLDRFSSPIAMDYGVKEIPTSYMINPDGKIIGVNMTYEQMQKMLSEKLTTK